jgi:tetratricopeptide (TPR) repeat protein
VLSPQDHAPLSFFLVHQVYRLLGDAEMTFRVVSVGSGLGFACLASLISHELAQNPVTRWEMTVLLIVQGYALLFFGYVETYGVLFAVSALYVYVAIRFVKGTAPLILPAGVLGVAICCHLAAISLVPSLLVLAIVRRERDPLGVFGSIALMPALAIGLLYLLDYPFSGRGGESLVSRHTLSIGLPTGDTAAYTIFAAAHFTDVLNALALASPAFVVGLPLFTRPAGRNAFDLWFLTLCLPPILMIWMINPEIGAFRDWDVLAFPGLFLTVALGRWLAVLSEETASGGWILLVGVSLLHLGPWVIINRDAEDTVLRFETLLATAPISRRGEVYGWDSLGGYHRDEGRHKDAYQAYVNALEIEPEHPRIQRVAGHTAGELERFDQAAQHFEAAIRLLPDLDTLRANYAKALLKGGRNSEAAVQFRNVLSGSPDQSDLMRLLGLAEFRSEKYEEALELANKIIERYPPGNVEDHVMVGSIYGLRGDPSGAIVSFQKALRISPRNVDTLNRLAAAYRAAGDPAAALAVLTQVPSSNRGVGTFRAIGAAYYAMESFDSAAVYYERALQLDEGNADLHYRLGSARLAGGRVQASVQSLAKAVNLDSTIAGAFRNLGTAYANLEQYEKAKEMLERLLTLQPDVSDRDALTQWIQEH